ncbi:MAG: HlyD family efflux transporter periplasmic adaptor subunit [Bacteroidales bacterium]|nr:HlyD family efflux transporter periplasmic adaptor subunit [Bacteroidales bacterium]
MPEDFEIRSDEVREIMGQTPRWITRWGTSFIFGICILLLVGSWFFKYPDILESKIVITTEQPPASIVSHANGTIDTLFVEDKQKVGKGQVIAIIENPSAYEDMLKLIQLLDTFGLKVLDLEKASSIHFLSNLSLGEVQSNYAAFIKHYNDYVHFKELDYHRKKIASLEEEIKKHNQYYNQLYRQSQILQKEYRLSNRQYSRDSTLYATGYISLADFEKTETQHLQKQYAFEQALVNLSSTKINISKIEQQILDLELDYIEQKKQQQLNLMESWENLLAAISVWEQNYVLKAPIDGTVSFTKFWSENQKVNINEKIFTIIPDDPGEMIGKLDLPINRSGKVKIGQDVNIMLANYPYLEYGLVRGEIRNISLVPELETYSLEVDLPEGLHTNYNKILEFNQEMQGTAEIVTEEMRLLMRIINPLKLIWEKNVKGTKIQDDIEKST